ncbi:MAG: glycyl-tRNA synthetase beta chain [Alteromonadaceae bacterium]|jgi:glycyl-tRNA synthetase beta chain
MNTDNLLVEIGTEELPPKSLKKLAQAFADNTQAELEKLKLDFTEVTWLASPRRLAIKVQGLAAAQQDVIIEKRGPAISVAFDAAGEPTKAAIGWARGNGITVELAQRLETDKGTWLLHKAQVKGKDIAQLIPGVIANALSKLPIPKMMKWGNSKIQFIRPVHTVTMFYGSSMLSGEILGKQASNEIRGHRFHHQGVVTINHADEYEDSLNKAYVSVNYEQRKATVKAQVEQAARDLSGIAVIDDELLDEVTSLVEWPVTLVGSFEEAFLNVPSEALIYTMKDNQKYFPVTDKDGKLLPKFIFVSNIESKDPQQIIHGNEKVIRPRLADAEFFFNTDKKTPLGERLQSLETVLFQKQLGTLKDKSVRIAELSAFIADQIGADINHASRAGLLSKTDLMTDMVVEFPGIQGVMGMYYARHDGEHDLVATALNEQYQPRFAGDELPSSPVSCAVAIADKVDSLVGIFGIGQPPKADKDPFALRRAAIGILRIIVEKDLPLDLTQMIDKSMTLYGDKLTADNIQANVIDFVLGRFRAWYQEQSIHVDVIQAVLALRPTRPADFDKRVQAVTHFLTLDGAQSLAAANKRVSNILNKFTGELPSDIDVALLELDEEKALASLVEQKSQALEAVYAAGDYQQALVSLADLKDPVDSFFDNVMVMADDEAVKHNRLALLNKLHSLFLQTADISLLQ